MSLSGRTVKIFTAAAAAAFCVLLFFASSGQVFYYHETGHPAVGRSSGYVASIPNSIEGLHTGFSLPHQNRRGESFWLHLSFSFNPEEKPKAPLSVHVVRLSIRDAEGRAVFLEGRRSSNPDFARAVHFEAGTLVGLRALQFDSFFVAGIPFDLASPPRQLSLEYEFLVKLPDGREEKLTGVLHLERGVERSFRFILQPSV